jgi:hypothetical protein
MIILYSELRKLTLLWISVNLQASWMQHQAAHNY